jgi:hypothetical protein
MSAGIEVFRSLKRSASAQRKALTHMLPDANLVHSFQTLLAELSSIVRNTCRIPGADNRASFTLLTTANATQQRALVRFARHYPNVHDVASNTTSEHKPAFFPSKPLCVRSASSLDRSAPRTHAIHCTTAAHVGASRGSVGAARASAQSTSESTDNE